MVFFLGRNAKAGGGAEMEKNREVWRRRTLLFIHTSLTPFPSFNSPFLLPLPLMVPFGSEIKAFFPFPPLDIPSTQKRVERKWLCVTFGGPFLVSPLPDPCAILFNLGIHWEGGQGKKEEILVSILLRKPTYVLSGSKKPSRMKFDKPYIFLAWEIKRGSFAYFAGKYWLVFFKSS